ncbi:MAG: carboxypeptidase regulatory-like domain-containing protein [Clostridia bacterium]|nr:carboxypeptidase regulatory-like domain-containing protein [Clostridia bacterium]
MDETKRNAPTSLVEQYRQQLLDMYRQQAPTPTPPADANWLDEQYPLPDIDRDMATEKPSPSETALPPMPPPAADRPELPLPAPQTPSSPPPIAESPFVGYLRVFVFTGGGAEPLSGARVTVSREEDGNEVLYANAVTDIDGFTPVIPLPSVDPELSMRPDQAQPFVPYDIGVSAAGFRSVRHENVPIYGNNYVTQPITMTPLLPGVPDDNTQFFQSGGPADL